MVFLSLQLLSLHRLILAGLFSSVGLHCRVFICSGECEELEFDINIGSETGSKQSYAYQPEPIIAGLVL